MPPTATRASVEAELEAARAWAVRHGWIMDWDPEKLTLRATTYHRPVSRLVEVVAEADGYRAVPPAWKFVQPGTDAADRSAFPAAGTSPGIGSIFHSNPVICAPWNRLAYVEHGGPHDNWSGPSSWLQVRDVTTAHTIADMLSALDVHLRASPGLMA